MGSWLNLMQQYPVLISIEAELEKAYQLLKLCYRNKGKLLIAGNGGSAADADHIVGELMKGFMKRRELDDALAAKMISADPEKGHVLAKQLQTPLPAISLVNHMALSTAFANDVNPELVFAQQLLGYGCSGDLFLAISTSGNSKNLIYATILAKVMGIKVIALTGANGGELAQKANLAVKVPETETYATQELHLPIYHYWCAKLEDELFKN